MNRVNSMLQPLTYHRELRDYLKTQERDLWEWYSSPEARANDAESLRTELIQAASRLDADSHHDLYRWGEEAKQGLQLDVPLTLYHARKNSPQDALIFYQPGEVHLVLPGSVESWGIPGEIKTMLGHGLAQFHLWRQEGSEFLVADRLLQALARNPRVSASHIRSAHYYQLATKIYTDRGALQVVNDLHTVVTVLAKTSAGLAEVDAAACISQARDYFEKPPANIKEISRPEIHLRTQALALWADGKTDTDSQIRAMLGERAPLDELDLLGQARLTGLTKGLLAEFLLPRWFQTEVVLEHARKFFPDFVPGRTSHPGLMEGMKTSELSRCEYVSYLMLDFATVDPELEERPLAAALEFSRKLGIEDFFENLAMKELKLKSRDLNRIKLKADGFPPALEATP